MLVFTESYQLLQDHPLCIFLSSLVVSFQILFLSTCDQVCYHSNWVYSCTYFLLYFCLNNYITLFLCSLCGLLLWVCNNFYIIHFRGICSSLFSVNRKPYFCYILKTQLSTCVAYTLFLVLRIICSHSSEFSVFIIIPPFKIFV